jgi:hypothetical protein
MVLMQCFFVFQIMRMKTNHKNEKETYIINDMFDSWTEVNFDIESRI